MKLLALDASTEALSVALLDTASSGLARAYFEIAPKEHARKLLPLAGGLLAEAGWALCAIDGLAFGRGPGAFTGLRIAAGLVQGLAMGLELPVAPVSTLAAIAARCFARSPADYARIILDASMGEIYTADYARGEENRPRLIGAERVIKPTALARDPAQPVIRGGNGWNLVAHTGPDTVAQWPHALDIARLAAVELAAGHGVDAAAALPVYVRDEVARKPAFRG